MLIHLCDRSYFDIAPSFLNVNATNPICQQIMMGLKITFGCANVDPVCALRNVSVKDFSALQQIRKQTILKRIVVTRRDKVEYFRFQDVSSRVYCVAGNFIRLRLLEKATNATVSFCLNKTVG